MAEQPAEEQEKNPYYEFLNPERRTALDDLVDKLQEFQSGFDQQVVNTLGGGMFYLGGLVLRQHAMILALEQRIEELEELIR